MRDWMVPCLLETRHTGPTMDPLESLPGFHLNPRLLFFCTPLRRFASTTINPDSGFDLEFILDYVLELILKTAAIGMGWAHGVKCSCLSGDCFTLSCPTIRNSTQLCFSKPFGCTTLDYDWLFPDSVSYTSSYLD